MKNCNRKSSFPVLLLIAHNFIDSFLPVAHSPGWSSGLFSDFLHRSHFLHLIIVVPFLPYPWGDQNCSEGSQRRLLEDKVKRDGVTKHFCPLPREPASGPGRDGIRSYTDFCFDLEQLILSSCVPVCLWDKHAGMLDVPHKQKHAILHFPSCLLRSLILATKKARLNTTPTDRKALTSSAFKDQTHIRHFQMIICLPLLQSSYRHRLGNLRALESHQSSTTMNHEQLKIVLTSVFSTTWCKSDFPTLNAFSLFKYILFRSALLTLSKSQLR